MRERIAARVSSMSRYVPTSSSVCVGELSRHELEQEQRALVGPVQVVQDDARTARERLALVKEARDRVEEAEAGLLRIATRL